MVLNLPLSTRQTKALEELLATCDMTKDQELLFRPVLQRLRQNIQYANDRNVTVLDRFYDTA
jgi:hypothetical protein